jgi:hypothetical protein
MLHVQSRIAGHFRGVQFSPFLRISGHL